MIKKKNNAYKLIKAHAPKLALIHHATDYSPQRLASLFLNNTPKDELAIQKKNKGWLLGLETGRRHSIQISQKADHDISKEEP